MIDLNKMFKPESVAVIGASNTPGIRNVVKSALKIWWLLLPVSRKLVEKVSN